MTMNCITFRVFTVFLLHAKLYHIFVNCYWVGIQWQYHSTPLHTNITYNTINNKNNTINNLIVKSADRAPSLPVIPWHLPYS
jgi:hypothetical protein